MKIIKTLFNLFERIVLSSIFIATTATIGVLAGLYAGLYAEGIKISFPLNRSCLENKENCFLNNDVLQTWILIIIFWLMFCLTGFFQSRRTRLYEKKLESKTNELLSQTSTMPPKGFMTLYLNAHIESSSQIAKYFHQSQNPLNHLDFSSKNFSSIVNNAESSRLLFRVLADIANLAFKFDNSPEGVKYEVNLMVYRQIDDFSHSQLEKVIGSCQFVESNQDPKKLAGFLEVIPGAKCLISGDQSGVPKIESNIDKEPKYQLILPVHPGCKDEGSDFLFRNMAQLPGAPELCDIGRLEVAYYESIRSLNESLGGKRDFRLEINNLIDTYFSTSPEIKSFASFPIVSDIFSSKTDDFEIDFFGVLNIHSNKNNVLGSYKRAFDLFLPLLVSYMPFLSVYLKEISKSAIRLKDESFELPLQ